VEVVVDILVTVEMEDKAEAETAEIEATFLPQALMVKVLEAVEAVMEVPLEKQAEQAEMEP
jgi:hypothetical protein